MEIQITSDGSHTLYIPELDEHYHSINGAIQESRHVFIEAGLNQCKKDTINILELGFGTGLNAFLSAMEAEKQGKIIIYTTLEKFPLPQSVAAQLNYASYQRPSLFSELHRCEWDKPAIITPFFSLHKIQTDFADYDYPGPYDVVYYDAFAPDKQANVWTPEIFRRIFQGMTEDGILTTYCAKGEVRRMMLTEGFQVERIPGPPGKRQMLRGRKELRIVK